MSLFLNQTQSEKSELQSKEQQLTQSLTQTLEQLNRKEDECEANQKRIKELQLDKEKLDETVRGLHTQLEHNKHSINQLIED